MTMQLNNKGTLPKEDEEFESLDEGSEEDFSLEGEPCPVCQGEGIAYSQDDNDEEDKDFKTCTVCGGSGIDPESQREENLDDY